MQEENVIIVGAGPCGMSCAMELQKQGINPLIIEKGNIVNTIYNFPTHQTFFSSSEKLEIGSYPFISERQKPVRNEALAYYRAVAQRSDIRVHSFELVNEVIQTSTGYQLKVITGDGQQKQYQATYVILATGYYDQPNYMDIPGEELPKVMHYFKEAHAYYRKNVTIIGGKNSAVDAALELYKAGANITVLYRGNDYSPSIKPWILPDFDALVKKDLIHMAFQAHPTEITADKVIYQVNGKTHEVDNDFVFAMTGYKPDIKFLSNIGITYDSNTGKPTFNEATYETNLTNLYIAGVIAAGYNNNEIFIENGRFHGEVIANDILNKMK
ncbi:YpdA family putative bacillithiol disulfide reductase [Ornithinibacillus gellani]|uniref:YpdA family putative bacillithiol disulfide reductase n=1 Tax=Ornithinibacillus gellani TaxID=2293253 RepID=UPI000F473CFE|nr:YpdA family putative bacillithiol disulfide reductase [Ornithinibacillus gellani]TQS74434.1 YpdA family putative bacillithiol disulfide reductase [Ornithinibacillus gellani]